jgi:galactokinase
MRIPNIGTGFPAIAEVSPEERQELDPAVTAFKEAFRGEEPCFLSRAPGRVNLIGEHTDYNGLPVLPMALKRRIQVLASPREDSTVRIVNTDPEFPDREFNISALIPADPTGDWGNYLKASCQMVARRFCGLLNEGDGDGLASEPEAYRGFDAVVSSTLPVASGLSSSSALGIAMGQAALVANGLEMDTLDFANNLARAERYTGTQGGGMDQAISAGAKEGHVSRIEFNPLRMFATPVPTDWRFLVAHTLVRAEKSGAAQEAYNSRTRECKRALDIVWPAATATEAVHGNVGSYRQLLDSICIEDLVQLGEEVLNGTLLKRFRHVVTEGNRVYDAEEAMKRGDIHTFGMLMSASHRSLRDDYDVSSRELDILVELAQGAGAAGARLTGAGFGGCAVILTDAEKVDKVFRTLADGFYHRNPALQEPVDQVLFMVEPSRGASVGDF